VEYLKNVSQNFLGVTKGHREISQLKEKIFKPRIESGILSYEEELLEGRRNTKIKSERIKDI
jgi:hypothetical protein